MIDECELVSFGLSWGVVADSCNMPLVQRRLLVKSAKKKNSKIITVIIFEIGHC